MKYIRVRQSGYSKDTAKIILKDNRIVIETDDDNRAVFLKGIIDKWKSDYDYKDSELFRKIPLIGSHYSRLFFSDVLTKQDL